jgi:biotin transport system substrate-specific component
VLNAYIRFSSNPTIDAIIKVFLGTLLLNMGGSTVIRNGLNVPVTLQSLLVLIPAIWFGWRIGILCVILYIASGIAGLPVFAGGTFGIEKVLSRSSGGFFWGFVFAAMACGYIAERIKPQKQFHTVGLWLLGHIIILTSGIFWMIMMHSEGYWIVIKQTAPGLALKSAIGYFITQVIFRMLVRREEYYQK